MNLGQESSNSPAKNKKKKKSLQALPVESTTQENHDSFLL
jgi:hypothetical protein